MRLLTSGHKNSTMGDAGSGTSLATMPTETRFLPAGRLALPRILEETTQVGESPVLMAMLDSSSAMIALLNPSAMIALQGQVRGGQQPVNGASIHLYATGSAGVGAGTIDLLALNIVN